MLPFASHAGSHRFRTFALVVGLVVTAIVLWLATAGRQTVTHGLPARPPGFPEASTSSTAPQAATGLFPEATTTSLAPQAATGLHDDFSDRLSGWGETTNAKGSIRYEGGAYRVEIDQPNRGTFAPAPWEVPEDVIVEVDATKTSSRLGSFGVGCRHGDGLRYSALIDINTTWRITRIDVPGAKPRRLATGKSSAIQRSGTNHVALECRRGPADGSVQLILSVNHKTVGSVVDVHGLRNGKVGVELASGAKAVAVGFDNFVARAP